LDVGDQLAFKPGQVRQRRQNNKKKQRDLD
jgi:hypothetical protein